MNEFTSQNWNYCQFKNGDKKAIISLGASPDILDDSFIYFVTVLDEENNELFQEEFNTADAACYHINTKYSEFWDFTDLSKETKSDSGCSTCVAH